MYKKAISVDERFEQLKQFRQN